MSTRADARYSEPARPGGQPALFEGECPPGLPLIADTASQGPAEGLDQTVELVEDSVFSPPQSSLATFLWSHGGSYEATIDVVRRLYGDGRVEWPLCPPLEQLRCVSRWNTRHSWRLTARELDEAIAVPPWPTSPDEILILTAWSEAPSSSWDRYASVIDDRMKDLFSRARSNYGRDDDEPEHRLTWWRCSFGRRGEHLLRSIRAGALPSYVLAAALSMFPAWGQSIEL